MRGTRCLAVALAMFTSLAVSSVAFADYPADFPTAAVPGHWYSEANGTAPSHLLGYPVADSPTIKFWSAFQHDGGVPVLGYPISANYDQGPYVQQAFQKAILQWDQSGKIQFVNVFDQLHDAGKDAALQAQWQIPPPADTAADRGLSWSAVVARHLAMLNANPTLRAAYMADSDPLTHYGLPMSEPVDAGNEIVVRCQRAALQLWKTTTPWAAAGQVTIANGGDIAKATGLVPAYAAGPLLPSFAFVPGGPYRRDAWDIELRLQDLPPDYVHTADTEAVLGPLPAGAPQPTTPAEQADVQANTKLFYQLEAHGFVNGRYPTFDLAQGVLTTTGPVAVFGVTEVFQSVAGAQWEYQALSAHLVQKLGGTTSGAPSVGDESNGVVGTLTLLKSRSASAYAITYRAGNIVNGVVVAYAGAPGSFDLPATLARATLARVAGPPSCPPGLCSP